ncbi:hypothetical protein O3G_MSEX009916 [Manduca sexta]|uniref:Receptor ligand binding region domain-containing protein n=1 Tax=Manduca sexta TaxID=7130 RepID=A0A922CSJ2_MANSE|nr:hypothetical protein O3G_MSEX009916 [Manduca sexta]
MYVISLIILFLCAADGLTPKCTKAENFKQKCKDKKHILLLNTSDSQDINQFKTFSDDVEVIDEICPGGVQGLLAATTVLRNCYIVNLNVSDFYKFAFNKVSQYLLYGGDRNHSQYEIEACVVKLDTPNIICNNNTIKKFSYPSVKLMSENVEDYHELYNAVLNFPNKSHVEKHEEKATSNFVILICTDNEPNEVSKHYVGNDIKFSTHCERDIEIYQKDLLAVVTAKPLEIDYDIMVPIMLYQAPCYDENISKIHNYVTMTKCDHYKLALVEFLKSVGWTRVAVVSDNAAYSEKFEREVTALFDENQFAYTVVKCHESLKRGCNFTEALESLKKSDGRVFIANMDENNARIVQQQASHVWTGYNFLSSWIFKGFMLTGDTEAMGDVYSIFLEPETNQSMTNTLQHIHNNIRYKNSIISAIKMIRTAYTRIWRRYNEMERKLFFRKLTHKIRKQLSSGAKVNVHLKSPREVFTEMTIMDGKVTTHHKRQRRREDMSSCSFRRNDYHNPCDDHTLLNIMIVFVVIASCGLVAAIFYNRFDFNIRQYINLE